MLALRGIEQITQVKKTSANNKMDGSSDKSVGPFCQTQSPFWRKIGMAVSRNNQYDDDQYILEELPLGFGKYLYRVTYTYSSLPPVWYLKGLNKARNGEIRVGYNSALKVMLPGSIPGLLRQKLPRFKLIVNAVALQQHSKGIEYNQFANYCGENNIYNWKRVGWAAPDYNNFTRNLYILWEQDLSGPGGPWFTYKVSEIYSEMPTSWLLRGHRKARDGEFRLAKFRSRSNNFLKFKLTLAGENVEGFNSLGYPGAGVSPWTWLYSPGYKGTAWDGHYNIPPPVGEGWKTIGKAGMHLSTGRQPYYNYVLQERMLDLDLYEYRIYNPDNVDFAGMADAGPEYIRLKGNNKIRDMDIREAVPGSVSLELPGFYRVKRF